MTKNPALFISKFHVPALPVSVMMEGNLIRKVEPLYPSMAKQLHVQGAVIIKAWISRDGLIEREQSKAVIRYWCALRSMLCGSGVIVLTT